MSPIIDLIYITFYFPDCSVKGHRMLFRDSEIVGGGAERLLPPFSLEEIRSESMSIVSISISKLRSSIENPTDHFYNLRCTIAKELEMF